MSTAVATALRPVPVPTSKVLRGDPAAQAFMLLRIAFTVAPILFGLDKFAEVMMSDWPKYLAPEFNDLIPGSAQDAMFLVGGIEIVAGLVVADRAALRRPAGRRLARRNHRQPAARRRLRATSRCATSASCSARSACPVSPAPIEAPFDTTVRKIYL